MTVREALSRAENRLRDAGVPDAGADAAWLLCRALGIARGELPLRRNDALAERAQLEYEGMLGRRESREPLQLILGEAAFMGLDFYVAPGVLIPRQDTETLCGAALLAAAETGAATALDLCCGSGVLAACLARLAKLNVTASDISPAAASLTRRNLERHDMKARVLCGDLFEPVRAESFDMIVCNPPYIPRGDRGALQAEVLFDPPEALFSGGDGMGLIRRIAREATDHIHEGGRLLLEFGDGQEEAVQSLFDGRQSRIHSDMQGLARAIEVLY